MAWHASGLGGGRPSLALTACRGSANPKGSAPSWLVSVFPSIASSRASVLTADASDPAPLPARSPNGPALYRAALRFPTRPVCPYARGHCAKVLQSSCFASGSKGALQYCFSLYLPGNFFPYLIESLVQFEPKNELFYFGVVSSFSNINHFYYIIYVNCINCRKIREYRETKKILKTTHDPLINNYSKHFEASLARCFCMQMYI